MSILFQKEHIPWIKSGRKTATRRRWKRPHAKVGGTYAAQKRRYELRAECPIIEAEAVYPQPLGEMTNTDAKKEGYRTVSEFMMVWLRINGSWDDEEVVTVVEFHHIKGTG